MTAVVEQIAPSGSTRERFSSYAAPSSGATMVSPDVLTTSGISHYPMKVIFRRYMGPTVITTFVSFRPVDEILIPHSWQSTTLEEGIVRGGMEDLTLEGPSVLVVAPRRPVFRFTSGRRARRLPPRTPFVTLPDYNDE